MLGGLALLVILTSIASAHGWPSGGGSSNFPTYYSEVKLAHGILGSVAWVVFFPLGAILIRVLSSPYAVRIHGIIQIASYALLIATAGLGIWMAKWTRQLNQYHVIIGLVLVSVAFFQATAGLLQHYLYVRGHKTSVLALTHVWLGRGLITLGMINGGLGLLLSSDAPKAGYIAYGVIAAVIWLFYIFVVVCVQRRKMAKVDHSSHKEAVWQQQEHDPRCTCQDYKRRSETRRMT